MFDISWIEILFVAVLAIVIIGPKDLPKVFQMVGKTMGKAKRTVASVKASIIQLQREVDIDQGKANIDNDWRDLLPKEVTDLPDDFVPGSLPQDFHRHRRESVDKAIEARKATLTDLPSRSKGEANE